MRSGRPLGLLVVMVLAGVMDAAWALEPSSPDWARPKSASELAERLGQALERQDTLLVGRLIHPESDGDPDRDVLLGVIRSDFGTPVE
jgi:hypothetical protein